MAGRWNEIVDVSGEVLAADLKQSRLQLWLNERSHVSVRFSESQEEQVTTALRDHKTVRMNVKGRGKVSPQGKLLEITEVEELGIQPGDEATLDEGARPIQDILEELASEVPHSEWERLPADLTDNLDHYLYGTPKR
jgi:hypothetical protein